MKNSISKIALSLFAIVTIPSCSNSDDATPAPFPLPIITENVWKLDNYNYSRLRSGQELQTTTSGQPWNVIVIDSNPNNANSPFTNCQVAITFGTNDVGAYTVKSQITTLTDLLIKNMHIQCTIASGAGTGAIYDSTDSNITVNISKVDGKFVINIPTGVVLTRTQNDGLVNPPATFTLTAQKIR